MAKNFKKVNEGYLNTLIARVNKENGLTGDEKQKLIDVLKAVFNNESESLKPLFDLIKGGNNLEIDKLDSSVFTDDQKKSLKHVASLPDSPVTAEKAIRYVALYAKSKKLEIGVADNEAYKQLIEDPKSMAKKIYGIFTGFANKFEELSFDGNTIEDLLSVNYDEFINAAYNENFKDTIKNDKTLVELLVRALNDPINSEISEEISKLHMDLGRNEGLSYEDLSFDKLNLIFENQRLGKDLLEIGKLKEQLDKEGFLNQEVIKKITEILKDSKIAAGLSDEDKEFLNKLKAANVLTDEDMKKFEELINTKIITEANYNEIKQMMADAVVYEPSQNKVLEILSKKVFVSSDLKTVKDIFAAATFVDEARKNQIDALIAAEGLGADEAQIKAFFDAIDLSKKDDIINLLKSKNLTEDDKEKLNGFVSLKELTEDDKNSIKEWFKEVRKKKKARIEIPNAKQSKITDFFKTNILTEEAIKHIEELVASLSSLDEKSKGFIQPLIDEAKAKLQFVEEYKKVVSAKGLSAEDKKNLEKIVAADTFDEAAFKAIIDNRNLTAEDKAFIVSLSKKTLPSEKKAELINLLKSGKYIEEPYKDKIVALSNGLVKAEREEIETTLNKLNNAQKDMLINNIKVKDFLSNQAIKDAIEVIFDSRDISQSDIDEIINASGLVDEEKEKAKKYLEELYNKKKPAAEQFLGDDDKNTLKSLFAYKNLTEFDLASVEKLINNSISVLVPQILKNYKLTDEQKKELNGILENYKITDAQKNTLKAIHKESLNELLEDEDFKNKVLGYLGLNELQGKVDGGNKMLKKLGKGLKIAGSVGAVLLALWGIGSGVEGNLQRDLIERVDAYIAEFNNPESEHYGDRAYVYGKINELVELSGQKVGAINFLSGGMISKKDELIDIREKFNPNNVTTITNTNVVEILTGIDEVYKTEADELTAYYKTYLTYIQNPTQENLEALNAARGTYAATDVEGKYNTTSVMNSLFSEANKKFEIAQLDKFMDLYDDVINKKDGATVESLTKAIDEYGKAEYANEYSSTPVMEAFKDAAEKILKSETTDIVVSNDAEAKNFYNEAYKDYLAGNITYAELETKRAGYSQDDALIDAMMKSAKNYEDQKTENITLTTETDELDKFTAMYNAYLKGEQYDGKEVTITALNDAYVAAQKTDVTGKYSSSDEIKAMYDSIIYKTELDVYKAEAGELDKFTAMYNAYLAGEQYDGKEVTLETLNAAYEASKTNNIEGKYNSSDEIGAMYSAAEKYEDLITKVESIVGEGQDVYTEIGEIVKAIEELDTTQFSQTEKNDVLNALNYYAKVVQDLNNNYDDVVANYNSLVEEYKGYSDAYDEALANFEAAVDANNHADIVKYQQELNKLVSQMESAGGVIDKIAGILGITNSDASTLDEKMAEVEAELQKLVTATNGMYTLRELYEKLYGTSADGLTDQQIIDQISYDFDIELSQGSSGAQGNEGSAPTK